MGWVMKKAAEQIRYWTYYDFFLSSLFIVWRRFRIVGKTKEKGEKKCSCSISIFQTAPEAGSIKKESKAIWSLKYCSK